jgi:3-oxoadipate enol-lactonase
MPRIQANGIELFYEEAGEGTPLVVQGHHHMPWMVFQVPYFSQFYRVITFDRRGTGRSDRRPESGRQQTSPPTCAD